MKTKSDVSLVVDRKNMKEELVAGLEDSMQKIEAAREVIIKSEKESGTIPRPICKTGTLSFIVSQRNGHVHAACTTVGCVRWME